MRGKFEMSGNKKVDSSPSNHERVEFTLGETISNCEASKLGPELTDDLIDRWGDVDKAPFRGGEFEPDRSTEPEVSFDFTDCRCSFRIGLMIYCCGICGLGGISGGGETTELRDEPKFGVPDLLPRVALLAFARSVLDQSVIGWSSGIGGVTEYLELPISIPSESISERQVYPSPAEAH